MRLLLIALSALNLLAADCIVVSSNTILVRDIAGAVPLFQSADPEAAVGFTPAPGVERVLSARDLLSIARRLEIPLEPGGSIPSVCVERAARSIEMSELREVLTTVLTLPAAHLTILDFSRQPVPAGHMEFSLSSLSKPPENAPSAPVIWRGRLVYEGQRSVPIWAKISLTEERPALIATEQIAAGAIIRPGQLEVRQTPRFPFWSPPLDLISQAAGKTARRTILAGQTIVASVLAESDDVASGETVRVEVVDGQAMLTLDAIAESSGRKGDRVTLRNPSSGKTFRGIVEDKGKVIVRSSAGDES